MTIDELNRISSLPDVLSKKQLEEEFKLLLNAMQQEPKRDQNLAIMSALFELAERQWATYELLASEIKEKIEELILKIWDQNDLDSTEKLVGTIAHLGLSKAFSVLILTDPKDLNSEIRTEIASAIVEFGDNVSDPYSGMRGT